MTLGKESWLLRNGSFLHRRRLFISSASPRSNTAQFAFGPKRLCFGTDRLFRHRLKSSSWIAIPVTTKDDAFNGWLAESLPKAKTRARPIALFASAFAGALLAAVAYFFYTRGFRLTFRKPYFKQISSAEYVKLEVPINQENETVASRELEVSSPVISQINEPVKANVPVDSTQLEAFSFLKKLNIVEDDAKADELCTRREYCRWLLKLNSLLERNPKHKTLPAASLSGTVTAAFDDVALNDPDFSFIQCLAESGVVRSKLSSTEVFNFYPDRFVTRNDVIQWKIPIEYGFMGFPIPDMSAMKFEFMDMKEIDEDAIPEFLMDLNATDNSIFKQVFGQSKRIQPSKFVSKAQASVALFSGRNKDAVKIYLINKEAEEASKMALMEEIKAELEERGEIEMPWKEKMEEEGRLRGEKEEIYEVKMRELEDERLIQDEALNEALKEREAMKCQKILCESTRSEIEMTPERVEKERIECVRELGDLQKMGRKLEIEKGNLENEKLGLQSELEAVQMLRRTVEEDGKMYEARGRLLGEVSRRWRWDDKTGQ